MLNDEQLFTELTPEEGASISGGLAYYIGNKTNIGVNFSINNIPQYLPSGKEYVYYYDDQPEVKYDSIIGSGYKVEKKYPNPGKNNFDRYGNHLFLTTGSGGPVANLVGP